MPRKKAALPSFVPLSSPPVAAGPDSGTSFEEFVERLRKQVNGAALAKGLKMLKAERFQLFTEVQDDAVLGIVKSQTNSDLVYSCRLTNSGTFACCTQNLNRCGGLQFGSLCKHLLVLVVGLVKAKALDPDKVNAWVKASRGVGYTLDRELIGATLLRYKGAEAGEIDWRPTETIPEDYYTL